MYRSHKALMRVIPLAVAAQRVDISGEGVNERRCSASFEVSDAYIKYVTVGRKTLWGCSSSCDGIQIYRSRSICAAVQSEPEQ